MAGLMLGAGNPAMFYSVLKVLIGVVFFNLCILNTSLCNVDFITEVLNKA